MIIGKLDWKGYHDICLRVHSTDDLACTINSALGGGGCLIYEEFYDGFYENEDTDTQHLSGGACDGR